MSKSLQDIEFDDLPKNWQISELNEVCEYITDKISVDSINIDFFVSTENMIPEKGGIVQASGKPKSGKVVEFKKEDILLSNIRTYFKKLWFARFDGGCSADVLVIRTRNELNKKYLFYCLSQNSFFDYTVKTSKGTKMPRGDKDAIMKFQIAIPSYPEQERIAEILSNIDAKIELMKQQNKTLESIGKTIFKQWFVDFEFPNSEGNPYKSSGGEMIESELGEIPKGWRIGKFREIMDIKGRIGWRGYTSEDLVGEGPWVIGGREINNGYIDFSGCKHITDFKYEESPEIKLREKDIILAKTGTIGPVAMYREYMGNATINPNVGIIRAINVLPEYLLYLLKEEKVQHYLKEFATTTVQAAINQETIKNMAIAIPERETQKKYESLVLSSNNLINQNVQQINVLQKTRDLLLPKLMSGKIRVEATK